MATPLDALDFDWSSFDGLQPLEAIVIVKALDEDGEVCLLHRASKGLRSWEGVGMVLYTSDTLRRSLLARDED